MNGYNARVVKEYNEDIKTNGDKGVNVEMTDKQFTNLKSIAFKVGFSSPGNLLKALVGDLTGWHSNGSDERHMANEWLDRAFGIWGETSCYFRYYLHTNYSNADIEEMWENKEFFEEIYSEYLDSESEKAHDSKDECIKIIKELNDKFRGK